MTKTGHKLNRHAAAAASTEAAGNSEYWSCEVCDKYYADAEGASEITEESWIIPAFSVVLTGAEKVNAVADGNTIALVGTVETRLDLTTLTYTADGYTVELSADGKTLTAKFDGNVAGVYTIVDKTAVKPTYVEIVDPKAPVVETEKLVDTKDKTTDEKSAVETVAQSAENKIDGVTEAAAQTIVEAAENAKTSLTEAEKEKLGNDITIEAQVIVSITPIDIDFSTEKKLMNLDVTPEIQLKAKGNEKTVDLETIPVKELATWVTVRVEIPAGFKPTVAKHHLENGGIEWLAVTVVEENGHYFAEWKQRSFSTVDLIENTSRATVKFTFADGHKESVTYTAADLDSAFPTDSKSGCTFNGWKFYSGAELIGSGKTLNDELLTKLNGKTLTAKSDMQQQSSGDGSGVGGGAGGGAMSVGNAVMVAKAENGAVSADVSKANVDDIVTLSIAPKDGYKLDKLTIANKDGKTVTFKKVNDTKYTFVMPDGKVNISATFVKDTAVAMNFIDVAVTDYFYDAVLWAAENGITSGVDETHFAPMAITTRGQMVTFLWRAAGSPEPTEATCAFTDVKAGEYYYKAVLWAVETGITKGTSDTTFSPDANVSRSQTVTFLARMSGVKDDAAGYSHNFADVSAADYFNNAVAWAATNKITDGTSATTFSPNDDCLRGQIVTFLYRNFVK